MTTCRALIPCLRYADAPAAIEFLCRAFGFEKRAVYADPENPRIVMHAELTLDGQMVMLGSGREDGGPYQFRAPAEAQGVTQTIYAVVDDPDAHHAAAAQAGAAVIEPPHDNPGYPGRSYTARDPDGHVWSFGSYDPFA